MVVLCYCVLFFSFFSRGVIKRWVFFWPLRYFMGFVDRGETAGFFFFGFVRFVCAANTYLDFLLHEVDSFLRFCGAMHMGGRGCVMDYGSVTWHTSTKVSNNKVYIQYIHVLTVKK